MDFYTLFQGQALAPPCGNPTDCAAENWSTLRHLYAAYLSPLTPYLAPLRPLLFQAYGLWMAHVQPLVTVLHTTLLALTSALLSRLLAFLAAAPPAASLATALALLLAALYVYVRVTALARRLVWYVLGWAVSMGFWAALAGWAYYVYHRGVALSLQDAGWFIGLLGEWWARAREEGERSGRDWEARARYEGESRRLVREWARREGRNAGGWGW